MAFAESDVKAKEFRLAGEKKGYWPTLQLVTIYDVLAKYNFKNYAQIYNNFTYNNLNAGVNINVPMFSAKTRANVALAQADLDAAKLNLANKRTQVSAEVRQRSRKVQEMDAAKEVARLELQLAQQNVAVLQAQFGEGKAICATWKKPGWTKTKSGWRFWTRTFRDSRRSWNCCGPRDNSKKRWNKRMLEKDSLDVLRQALEKLESGFASLPEIPDNPGYARIAEVLGRPPNGFKTTILIFIRCMPGKC